MGNKLIFTALTLMCLIGSISITSAQVTKIGTGQNPAIYGSKVTWSDTAGSIHVYDLTAKKDTKINSSKASYPTIYGNKLVWHDESSGAPRLTVYDIPTNARSFITKNIDTTSIPKIYGSRIVWSSNGNVYMRDISTSTQTQIAIGNSPDIYGTKITYCAQGDECNNVYVYDIVTKQTIQANLYGDLYNPHIYGNKVICSNFYTRLGFIEMYDLITKKETDVTSDNTGNTLIKNVADAGDDTGTHIGINGDKIVYSKCADDQFGYAGVYVDSISTGQNTPVFYYPSLLTTPEIYGNTIVWGIDQSNSKTSTSNNGIYICDLAAKPVASFTANQTSGTHSFPVTFTYLGTGAGTPKSYHWDFGDKTTSNNAFTITHIYTKAGTYTISLKVSNAAGSSTATKTKYITVK